MSGLRRLAVLVVCGCMSSASSAGADVVTDWNAIATQSIFSVLRRHQLASEGRPSSTSPWSTWRCTTPSRRSRDATSPTRRRIPNATGSPVAAAASAAHDVLVNRFPAQAGKPRYDTPELPHRLSASWATRGGRRPGRRRSDHRPADRGRELALESGGLHRRHATRRMAPHAPGIRTDAGSVAGRRRSLRPEGLRSAPPRPRRRI